MVNDNLNTLSVLLPFSPLNKNGHCYSMLFYADLLFPLISLNSYNTELKYVLAKITWPPWT